MHFNLVILSLAVFFSKYNNSQERDNCFIGVGVALRAHELIMFTLDGNHSLYSVDFMNISVGFRTRMKQGILMQIRDENNIEYISLELNNAGKFKQKCSSY